MRLPIGVGTPLPVAGPQEEVGMAGGACARRGTHLLPELCHLCPDVLLAARRTGAA
jgi:hypothetical protein